MRRTRCGRRRREYLLRTRDAILVYILISAGFVMVEVTHGRQLWPMTSQWAGLDGCIRRADVESARLPFATGGLRRYIPPV